MAYIFLDESGDLGFNFKKKKTSRYFVVTLLYTEHKEPLEKIVKKIFKGFRQVKVKHHPNTLHAHKESDQTRDRIFKLLEMSNIFVTYVYIDKKKILNYAMRDKHLLYNQAVMESVKHLAYIIKLDTKVNLIASRRETSRFLNKNFINDVMRCLANLGIKINVDIRLPQQEKSLQIADFVSWAIYRKYDLEDDTFYSHIKAKIVGDKELSFKHDS